MGFQTRLYELMSPQAYLDSVARVAANIRPHNGERLLDVGCGSGILIPQLDSFLQGGGVYVGLDRLAAGVGAVDTKACGLRGAGRIHTLQADMTQGIPLQPGCIDTAVAHCSIYIVKDSCTRLEVYREIFRVLKPGGRFLCVNPSTQYNAPGIIRQSLVDLKGQAGWIGYSFRRWIVYPLALRFGLNYVEEQLKAGEWKAFSPEEMSDEIKNAGFEIEESAATYADSALFMRCRKP